MEIKILNKKICLKAETGEDYNLLVDILLAGGLRVIQKNGAKVLLEPGVPLKGLDRKSVEKMIKKFKDRISSEAKYSFILPLVDDLDRWGTIKGILGTPKESKKSKSDGLE